MEDQPKSIYEQLRDEQEYYEEHRDDNEWEVVPAPDTLPAKPLRRTMISARFSPDEAEEIRIAANREGATVSAFLRASALERARWQTLRFQLPPTAISISVSVHLNAYLPVNYSNRQLESGPADADLCFR